MKEAKRKIRDSEGSSVPRQQHSKKEKRDKKKKEEDIEMIDSEHYFSKHAQFCLWLKERKSLYFNDLTSTETHDWFDEFVKKWNSGRLQTRYYVATSPIKLTRYNWRIKHSSKVEK
eukprot:g8911.t1